MKTPFHSRPLPCIYSRLLGANREKGIMILLSGPSGLSDLAMMARLWIGVPVLIIYLLYKWNQRHK